MNPPDTGTIKAAMLGDAEAARVCTEAGYALPCPHCGERARIIHSIKSDLYSVECLYGCGAETPMRTLYQRAEDALADWNLRVDLREAMKELEADHEQSETDQHMG